MLSDEYLGDVIRLWWVNW